MDGPLARPSFVNFLIWNDFDHTCDALLYPIEKIHSMWVGAGYGIILWCIVFLLLNPLLTPVKPILNLSIDTIITTLCVFILYGTFIGYSISFDYLEMKIKTENEKSETTEDSAIK